MSDPRWLTEGAPHVWRPYCQMKTARPPLPVVATRGARLILEDGRELVDGLASWWTACHGYNHPHIAGALRKQIETMPHVMFGGLAHEPAYRLAKRLARLLPGDLDHVFFAESGSVAVEIAMKMALQHQINRGVGGRTRFLAFRGGYHGDTLATMTVCDPEEGMHSLFAGVMPAQVIADLPRDPASEAALDALLAARGHEIAAMLVEPLIQGAGGMLPHPPEVLRTLRRLADKHGVLLIFDEIFTGFGRTGSLFAMQAAGVEPDIVTLSKALTGGTLPLSAAVARRHVFEAFWSDDPGAALMHGPTYMANPLACAAANASLDLFEDGAWARNVARVSAALAEGLEPCRAGEGVVDVRTLGAIGVVEFEAPVPVSDLCARFAALGVWIRPMGKVVYLTPAFTTPDEDLSRLTSAVRQVVGVD
ncbi:adenosylmethionine--8-amino-7-oxononanoate transaminase [Caulobacter vibrioides]|uniref:adenosylmethionine--8-amino-7-oxononanoate transaminase n=1 Tax=Caulobacter vibrioides TaxID=155892 RepID=UPI000BB4B1F0|nr:adenosylmethionine--8-amino-7-oxononanoate transaminase [Caulobacter vibrioides]ATC24589.1 adenosylmethionine--8-amino-7-oxononanoate transaminase [Caulobacter vibrioides]AZH12729.1 adenosylmethionine--8-amino-7-oxononanoate transaminase [Caulobacter vibrioides]PLR10166.1 adenosylmethionine--8-amino-7-oxononanoate transaminase [Caulobacter vibrioides]